jgi:mono/diheme cytochrome c family protein
MPTDWPRVDYEDWSESCDTLHAHTQVLGKLAAELAPPEPQLQHAALRLTARGWETAPLPAPNGSGAFVAALDLHAHEALAESADGRRTSVPLTPDRPVGAVARELLAAVREIAGPVEIDPAPQEVPWSVPLDEDTEHARYDKAAIERYLAAATRAALALAAFRAPFRGRSTPVHAWWGSFDLAVSLFSGAPAEPPSEDFIMRNAMDSQEVAVGWWPGDPRYPHAAFYAYAHPAPEGIAELRVEPAPARWDGELGELVLDWEDVRAAPDPHAFALEFLRSAFAGSCGVCEWDPKLAASAEGDPPPVS